MAEYSAKKYYDTSSVNIVSQGVCDTVAYFEKGADFSALAPRDTICPSDESHTGDSTKELGLMVQITMYVGLIFLLIVMVRSCSRTSVDWYRLIFLYIMGTLGFPITLALGPGYGGFNRVVGFGVMVHNTAELFILGRIWRGMRTEANTSSFGTKFIVMYIWIILTLLTFLPLSPLFLIAMIQGAWMDWTLVLTFLLTGVEMQRYHGRYFWYGFSAALSHILSIQPLFFGFATGISSLYVITVIFLIPTFIIYIWFASADSNTPANIISPVSTGTYMMDKERNAELEKISRNLQQIEMSNPVGQDSEPASMVGSTQNQNIKARSVSGASTGANNDNDDNNNNDNGQTIDNENPQNKTVLRRVLYDGLLSRPNGKKQFFTVFGIAGAITITNALVVWFSPCYIDTAYICK